MLLPRHHHVRHDWVLVHVVTIEAIFSCAAVPNGNPHPKRVEKLNWSTEVWNVSSGVASCLGALDAITAQAEIEQLKEKTRKCEVLTKSIEMHCAQPAMHNWSKLNAKIRQNCLQDPLLALQVHCKTSGSKFLHRGGFTERGSNPCSCPGITMSVTTGSSFQLSP